MWEVCGIYVFKNFVENVCRFVDEEKGDFIVELVFV